MDTTGTPRLVPVALYIVTSDEDARPLLTDYCRQYATARDWDIAETVTDTDRMQPLDQRPGWARILAALSDSTARGIITYSPAMIAAPAETYEAVRRLLLDRGAFLVATRGNTANPEGPPRRTPAQTVRRQSLADAAHEGCGADWSAFGAVER